MSLLNEIIEQSFTQYAGMTLQSRALVDVRDCLKPSARQIFYSMLERKLISSKPYKKTANAVGMAMADYYLHGDSSCEGIIMRAGQSFAMRYPITDIKGNSGSLIESGNWAAMRYTESRLSKIADLLFKDLDKDTITEWRDNYDNTKRYPMVLPAKGYYNIVNGNFGLGVGAASSIPCFNLKEVNEALIKLLWDSEISIDELICMPDFPTGAILLNAEEVKESLKNGTGKACKLRSVIEFDAKEKVLIVTEIPYSVYTNTICAQLEEILNSEENPGIERFNDLTGAEPFIKIYLTKYANPNKVIKYLYKNTSLQYFYSINMMMLENGRYPKLYNWKSALQAFLTHQFEVYTRSYQYDLSIIEKRLHIIEGLLICIANIDEVVQIIKKSTSAAAAQKVLQEKFLLSNEQSKAILDTKLSRLAHLEVQKLKNEQSELLIKKEKLVNILNDEILFKKEIEKDLLGVAKKYGDARRTQILNIENEDSEVIEKKNLILYLTNSNYIFTVETSNLYTQKRNGVGQKFKLEKNEFVSNSLSIQTTDTLLFFTNLGNVYQLKAHELNLNEKIYIGTLLQLKPDEKIVQSMVLNNNKEFLILVTKKGLIKKSVLSLYETNRKTGMKALALEDNDEVISALTTNNNDIIGILTSEGQFLIIELDLINAIGRNTKGVKAIKLNENDEVISSKIIPNNTKEILLLTSLGYTKRIDIEEFVIANRYTKGQRIIKLKDNGDFCIDFEPIGSERDITVISTSNQITIRITDLPKLSREAIGVMSINLKINDAAIKLLKN